MTERQYTCTVTRVVDGDTLDARIDLGFGVFTVQRVRLMGVDAPETYRPSCEAERQHGQRATAFVSDLLLDRVCRLVTNKDKKGKYGRYLGVLYPPGSEVSVNDMLREKGLVKRQGYD